MPRHRALQSPRTRALRRKRVARVGGAFAAAFISVASAFILLLNSPYTRISGVSVSGAQPALAVHIQGIIEGMLQGAYLGLIPRDSAFLFPSSSLRRSLPAEFPELASVDFDRDGLSAVTAEAKLRQPAEIACVAIDACYYADADGVLFAPAPKEAGAFLIYRISLPAKAEPIRLDFLDAGRLRAMGDFVAGLARLGLATDGVTVQGGGDYRLDVRDLGLVPASAQETPLLMNEKKPFDELLQDFSAFWSQHLASVAAGKEKRALASVDMRYGDTIVYKAR